MLGSSLQILFLFLSPFLFAGLGGRSFRGLSHLIGRAEVNDLEFSIRLVFGLLIYLVLAFFLKACGLPWWCACFAPFSILVFPLKELSQIRLRLPLCPSANFVIWFSVILGLGISLFEYRESISTPWSNNYGDLTFHLGMISSFVFGDNIPPEYHLFAGERLSYPFFINFWSAIYWWVNPTWDALALIFTFQWTLLWCLVYFFLRGNRYPLLPWAVLFSGGAYFAFGSSCKIVTGSDGLDLCFAFGKNSGQLIGQNVPLTVFLTTIWVTQRTALFGVVTSLAGLFAFERARSVSKYLPLRSHQYVVLTGLLLALSPLVHAHFTIVTIFYIGGILLLSAWETRSVKTLLIFVMSLVPSFIWLPWLLGKSGTMKLIIGWSTFPNVASLPIRGQLFHSLSMWYLNAGFYLFIACIFWMVFKRHREMSVLLCLFLIANVVQLAVWEWDQTKVFISLYIIFLFSWSTLPENKGFWLHLLLVLVMIPAVGEGIKLLQEGPRHTVYSSQDIDVAEAIRLRTEKNDVLVVAPNHNTLGTLTGRNLFYGYEGTLNSHGLDFAPRQELMRDLDKLLSCKKTLPEARCPDYLVWTEQEQRYFKRSRPSEGFQDVWKGKLYRFPS